MVEGTALEDLRAGLRGRVLTPTDARYDELRRIHNGMFDRRPARAPSTSTGARLSAIPQGAIRPRIEARRV
jgi:hypothetical protein